MEPTKMDDLFKKVVDSHEGKASLSQERKDELWSRMDQKPASGNTLIWKMASVILLLLSTALTYTLFIIQNENEQLNRELALVPVLHEHSDPAPITNVEEQLPKHIEEESENIAESESFEDLKPLVKTEIQYVVHEIVVRDTVLKEVFITQQNTDSLLTEITTKEEEIALLQKQIKSEESIAYEPSSVNPVQVAFQNPTGSESVEKDKDNKFKFQLSLINF